jgi:Zn-dependent peptidase ImmA (M78 family)
VAAAATLGEARAAARVAREEFGLGLDQPVHDILSVVERTAGVPVAVLHLGGGVAGAYVVRRDRPFIFLNGDQAVARQRFTLAHELGHHRLGHAAVVDGSKEIDGKSDEPVEKEANAFAGEFLAPDQALRSWMQANGEPLITMPVVCRIGHWFGISAPAAHVRLQQANILQLPKQIKYLQTQINRGAHKSVERALELEGTEDSLGRIARERAVPRVPSAMRDNALAAYGAGLIDLDRLAGALRQDREATAELVGNLGLLAEEDPDW